MHSFFSRLTFIFLVLALAFSGVSMAFSWRTNQLKTSFQRLEHNRVEIQGNLRILHAEWARLNNPAHLKNMANTYFPDQLQHIDNQAFIDNIEQLERGSDEQQSP